MDNMGKYSQNLNDFLEEAELLQYSELFRGVLKISKVSQLKFVVTDDLEQIGLSKPEQRRYKKIFSKYFPNPYIYKLRKLLRSHKKHESGNASLPMEMQQLHDNNEDVSIKHIIGINNIVLNKELGKGQFGVVQQGTWNTGKQRLQVAIKCLGQERMTSNSAEFLKEAAVMHSIEHPSIVRLFGVVLHSDSLMLVTELAPLRSLLECLREVSIRDIFPVHNLCRFAEQICDGMSYLENKRLIHRDLAARNILVFTKNKVKISDFGLSRALGVGKDYYQTNYNVNLKLPVAWCAPECILFLRFTSASDVWAYGVCLWEMFTYGFQPWAGFSGHQILESIDHPNFQRLERPQCCPEAYYSTMLECWSHEPSNRPKFRDLGAKLRAIRPEVVETTTNFPDENGRRTNFLEFKAGETITVLGKENMTNASLWYGVTSGGACGVFDPKNTKPYVPPDKSLTVPSLSTNSTRHSARSIRSALLRSDVKRHTYTSKRTIQRSMISSPQGDVKHTGHVGLDGAFFGDVSFLDQTGCPPQQIVTPYKPSEDLEQVPLINPNSPSHLTGLSGTTPYPMLASTKSDIKDRDTMTCDKKNHRKAGQRSLSESTITGRGLLNKVKYATLGRSHKIETSDVPETEDVHEYHEISDDTTENTPTKSLSKQEELQTAKSSADFSQSLIAEMESLFRNLETTKRRDEPSTSAKSLEVTTANKKTQTLTKPDKRRLSPTSTMKPMSAHDEKTLNTAVALANEITSKSDSEGQYFENEVLTSLTQPKNKKPSSKTSKRKQQQQHSLDSGDEIRSMNDLGADKTKYLQVPHDRSKFHFKFPLSLHQHGHPCESERDKETAGKHERRNFSDEAKNVPDIQETFTVESKMAYTSLIDEPTPSTSRYYQRQKNMHSRNSSPLNRLEDFQQSPENPLPLPPRNTKPKLIDKPRHVRKYPLKIPDEYPPTAESSEPPPIIYQNTTNPLKRQQKVAPIPDKGKSVDVIDGPQSSNHDTNPFKKGQRPIVHPVYDLVIPGPSRANPFSYTFDDDEDDIDIDVDIDFDLYSEESDENTEGACALVKDCKDHVSVEDLLEFADQKPCGRQRGVESDEVRIMGKVFNKKITPEECLEALELSDWNVHNAIKLVRVSASVGTEVSLEACSSELAKANGDINKASAVLVMCKQKT